MVSFIKNVVTVFCNYQENFCQFLLNYTDFDHAISHIKTSQYDSTACTLYTTLQMFEKGWEGEALLETLHETEHYLGINEIFRYSKK